jgi:hypothetical protein
MVNCLSPQILIHFTQKFNGIQAIIIYFNQITRLNSLNSSSYTSNATKTLKTYTQTECYLF